MLKDSLRQLPATRRGITIGITYQFFLDRVRSTTVRSYWPLPSLYRSRDTLLLST